MKNLENLKLKELTKKDLASINGGESGFYYVGKWYSSLWNFYKGIGISIVQAEVDAFTYVFL